MPDLTVQGLSDGPLMALLAWGLAILALAILRLTKRLA